MYLEFDSTKELFKISEEKKIEFLQEVVLREEHRLLAIDGTIIMNKNTKNTDGIDLNYNFSMNL
jgi:hypothetical protein